MTIEELKAGFARLAEPIVPVEDPYGRLLRRARRTRRIRLTGWGSALAAGIVAAILVPLLGPVTSAGLTPGPSAGPDDNRGVEITGWVQRLLDSRTRGNLARDRTYLDTVTQRIKPADFGFSPELVHRTVLYAADVGAYRALLVAFTSERRQMGVWLVGDQGAPAEQLADAGPRLIASGPAYDNKVKVMPEELQPFTVTAVADARSHRYLSVGLAPSGCRVATKDDSQPDIWAQVGTVDFVERSDPLATSMSTLVRVTCDGVVHYQAPLVNNARTDLTPATPTDAQIDAALVGARGTPPSRDLVRSTIRDAAGESTPIDSCKVLYAGTIPGSFASSIEPGGGVLREPPVLVVACTAAGGNTQFTVMAENGGGIGGDTSVKLGDPHAIFAVRGVLVEEVDTGGSGTDRSSRPDTRVLVLAPTSATRLTVAGQTVPLTNGVGSVVVPETGSVPVQALDRSGTVVATGTAPSPGSTDPAFSPADLVDNWT
jgi:hypothetical protein